MNIDLSKFKVVYDSKILYALSLQYILFKEDINEKEIHKKPQIIEILIINEDGNIEALRDEAWRVQVIPILKKE